MPFWCPSGPSRRSRARRACWWSAPTIWWRCARSTPGEKVGDLLIVRDGVKPGDRVIVDGIQKARPGSPVNPSARRRCRSAGREDGRQGPGEAGRSEACREGGGEIAHGTVLHPATDRRHRHLDPDRHARRGHHQGARDRTVPVPRPAEHPRHRHLPRRLRGSRGAVGGDPHRAGGQRRRPPDLHEVLEHQRRPDAPGRQLRGRDGPGHGERPHPEPGLGGAGAPAAGGRPAGGHRQEAEPQHPDADLALLAQGRLRRQLPDQLLRHQPAGPAPPDPRASPRWTSSAARTTGCGSGFGPTSWPSWA